MVLKRPVYCGNCKKPVGFVFDTCPMQSVYCYECEDLVTDREESHEAAMLHHRDPTWRKS
jgi:hypothetical protein